MDKYTLFITLASCFFGSGGIVLWGLNRIAKKADDKQGIKKDLSEIKSSIRELRTALVMALENDKVIFKALKTHKINGESEEQERKMDRYFLSLIDKGEKKK